MNTDPTQDKAAEPATPEQLMQAAAARIAELEAERAEMKDRWMRAEAETANVRARARREVDETRQYAVQKFARDVVEAAENLKPRPRQPSRRRRDGEPEIVARLREGFAGVERSFLGPAGTQRHPPRGPDRRRRSTPTCTRRWPSRRAPSTRRAR